MQLQRPLPLKCYTDFRSNVSTSTTLNFRMAFGGERYHLGAMHLLRQLDSRVLHAVDS